MDEISCSKFNSLNYNNLKSFLKDVIYQTPISIKIIILLSLFLLDNNRQVCGISDGKKNFTDWTSRTGDYNRTNGEWVDNALYEALTSFTPAASKLSAANNSQCTNDGLLYRRHLSNLTMWAVQMYDSGVHAVSGVITADTYQLGHFDECLNVSYPAHNIRGKYCLVTLKFGPSYNSYKEFYSPPSLAYYEDPPSDSVVWDKIKKTQDPRMKIRNEIHLGVCVPSSCAFSDVQNSLNFTVSQTFYNHNLVGEIYVDESSCYTRTDDESYVGYYIMQSILLFIACLSVTATIYEYFFKSNIYHKENHLSFPNNKLCNGNGHALPPVDKKPSKWEETIIAFSMKANMNELVSEGVDHSLDVLNGGKFVCLVVIILGHRTLYTLGSALYNPQYWEESVINVNHMSFMNGTQVVDTFFLIGGFLTFRGVYSQLEKSKKFNLPLLIFFRWLRFMPVYLTMIGIYALLLIHLGSGPIWNMKVGIESENCQESWWLNVLFINNYVNPEKQCLLMSWYLTCDMHFFIVGSCIVFLLWRSRPLGQIACGVGLAVSLIIPFMHTYLGNHDGKLRLYQKLLMNPYVDKEFNSVYIRSHSRSIPYLCGIIVGYICHRINEANYTIPRKVNLAGISVFFIMYMVQVYSLIIYTPGRSYYVIENAIFSAILPLSWSIGSGWILMVQTTTGLGFYKWLFSQKIYTPLSRLSYCTVLIHPAVQILHVSSNVSSEYMTYPKLIWMSCGDITTSYLLALFLYLMVEAPFKNLQKMYLQPGGKRSEKSKHLEQQLSQEQNHHQTLPQVIPMTVSVQCNGLDINNHHITRNDSTANDNR